MRQLIQDKDTGLYFANGEDGIPQPTVTRDKAWHYEEHELLAVVRAYYGGDHGAERVTVSEPTVREHMSWIGRKGGSAKSERKARAVRRNGRKNKAKKQTTEPTPTAP